MLGLAGGPAVGITEPTAMAIGGGIGWAGGMISCMSGSGTSGGASSGGGSTSEYTDTTRPSAVRNIKTNVTPGDFGKNLEANGFVKKINGSITSYIKGNVQYDVYPVRGSTGTPGAQMKVGGEVVLKSAFRGRFRMRWITDQAYFNEILTKARACEKADASGKADSMEVLHFESMELLTRAFFRLMKRLLARGDDEAAYYLTLDPDPAGYFATNFATYPLVELKVNDSDDDYIATFNAEIGDSPANALGTNWWKYVVMPKSNKWFVVGTRDFSNDTNGHIWCPQGWSQWVKEEYPSAISD